MLRRSVRSFVVVIALLFGAILTSACNGAEAGGYEPLLISSTSTPTPSTPVVNTAGEDFQVVPISAYPVPAPIPVEVSPDSFWSARSWVWCKPGLMFGVVFVRDDGQKLTENTPIRCEGDVFRDIGLGPGRISSNPELMDFARGHVITADYGTVQGRDWTTKGESVRVWQNSLAIKFRVIM